MADNIFFHDFGKAAFGTLEVELAGVPGTVVELAIGESARAGRVNREPGGCCCVKSGKVTLDSPRRWYKLDIPAHKAPAYAKYTVPSPWPEEVAPFRYAEIGGNCQVFSLKRRELFPQWNDRDAQFESSSSELDRIWEFCKYSIKATAGFGIFIDGERERCPYEGDAYINQLGWFCCSAEREIPRRTLEFFRKNYTWPIEWSLLMPLIVRDYILYSGDRQMLTEMLPELPGRLLDALVREDGLIGNGEYYKELIDWPMNERDGYVSGGVSLVPNCLRVMALEAMAELTGRSAYLQQAAELKQVIRSKMFKNGRFTDSPETEHTAQHSLFFPVVSHVAAAGEVPELADIDIRCSVYAVQFLLESLYMAGYGQRALQLMLSDGQRSWSNMLRCGTTITLESWDPELKPNIDWNHAWGSAPANIIPRCLCGVRPVKAGFREFEFDPQPGGLTGFHSVHPTPHGSIEVEYDNGSFKVKMPENCAAVYAGKRWTKEFSGKLN